MRNRALFLLALLVLGCQSTPKRKEPTDSLDKDNAQAEAAADDETVTIRPDELEPVRRFLLETRRVVAAEFVRVDMTQQFFESQLGYTRDLRYVSRKMWRLKDGSRVIELKNSLIDQFRRDPERKEDPSNFDPDLLPRVYFGSAGLEVRAFHTLRIYIRNSVNKDRPIFLDIRAKNSTGDVVMWVTGRKQHEKPSLHLRSELIYSDDKEEYLHRSSIG